MDRRSQLITQYFNLGLSYDEILAILAEVYNIVLSKRHLKRLLRRLGLFRRKYHDDILRVAMYIENELDKSGQLDGYRWFHVKLRNDGYNVSKDTVLEFLRILDPDGVNMRKKRRLRRRVYNGCGPNFIWHVDSYDKLKPFGICINGCIDGYSRYIQWIEAYNTSSDPLLIAGYFMKRVKELKGCPRIVRADMGTENAFLRETQLFLRQNGNDERAARRSFLYGRSTSNQRIEFLWGVLRKEMAQFWMDVLGLLRFEGAFDGGYLDKALLQFVFLRLIQKELDSFIIQWNSHRISSSRRAPGPFGRPLVMYSLPMVYNTRNYIYRVNDDAMDACIQECRFKDDIPCSRNIFELCRLKMLENGWGIPFNHHEGIILYRSLRESILAEL